MPDYPALSVTMPSVTKYGAGVNHPNSNLGTLTIVGGSTALTDSDDSSYVQWTDATNPSAPTTKPTELCVEVAFGAIDPGVFAGMSRVELHVVGQGALVTANYKWYDTEYHQWKMTTRLVDGNGNHLYREYHATVGGFQYDMPHLYVGASDEWPWVLQVEDFNVAGWADNFACFYDKHQRQPWENLPSGETLFGINPNFDPSTGVYAYLAFAGCTEASGFGLWSEFSGTVKQAYLSIDPALTGSSPPPYMALSFFYKGLALVDSTGNPYAMTTSRDPDGFTQQFAVLRDGTLIDVGTSYGIQKFSHDLKHATYEPVGPPLLDPAWDGNSQPEPILELGNISVSLNYERATVWYGASFTGTSRWVEVDPSTGATLATYEMGQVPINQPASPDPTGNFYPINTNTYPFFPSPGYGGWRGGTFYGSLNSSVFDDNYGGDFWHSYATNPFAGTCNYLKFEHGDVSLQVVSQFGRSDYPGAHIYTAVPTTDGTYYVTGRGTLYPTRDGGIWMYATAYKLGPLSDDGLGNQYYPLIQREALIQYSVGLPTDTGIVCNIEKICVFGIPPHLESSATIGTGTTMLIQGPDGNLFWWAAWQNSASTDPRYQYREGIVRVDPDTLVNGFNAHPGFFFNSFTSMETSLPSWISFPMSNTPNIGGTAGGVSVYFSRGVT